MQPYLFPYIGYWQLINCSDVFVLYDDVNYINKGWINRNQILINNNAWLFTMPLKKASANKLINEIYITDDKKWFVKFQNTLERNYKKAEFYKTVMPLVNDIIFQKNNKLIDFIEFSLLKIVDYLEIDTKIIRSSNLNIETSCHGERRILRINNYFNASRYINAIGGKELYLSENFQRNNIELKFLKTNYFEYKQFGTEFVSNLSIIDILMFNDKKTIKDLLNKFSLV